MRTIFKKLKTIKKTAFPKNKEYLKHLIEVEIEKNGLNCQLNFIDVSSITDMSKLFFYSKFNGDISEWDVSNVTNMSQMFDNSAFNGDISKWDVSNVIDMHRMFTNSKFKGDISNWDIRKVKDMSIMFCFSSFNGKNIDCWFDILNVKCDCKGMFELKTTELIPNWWLENQDILKASLISRDNKNILNENIKPSLNKKNCKI